MSGNSESHVAIIGVTSQIGAALVNTLTKAGYRVSGISRSSTADSPCQIHAYNPDTREFTPPVEIAAAVISLAPLPNINEALEIAELLGATRIVAFGSTGVFSKAESTSALEREFVREQLDAERQLSLVAESLGIHWTLFRPTMIYGANADQNVTFIRNVTRRLGFFPVPVGAKGTRQPVHVADLAEACAAVLKSSATFNRAYNLGGGEVLRYSDMVRRICQQDGRRRFILPVPRWLYRWIVKMIGLLPGFGYIRVEMIDRMYTDLIADNSDAQEDFGYRPRKFEPPRSS